jgi:hypothetical protein
VGRFFCIAMLVAMLVAATGVTLAQTPGNAPWIDPSLYQELRYRVIGPFRASRTVGGVGIPTRPSVFFVGVNNGGVWKTDDYGRTWRPIFDRAPTGSVGDLAVSPSHPDVLYVGSGEGLHRPDLGVGDGIFKSTDGGATWQHVGLPDIQQVGRIAVHPTNPDIVFVAGMGHPSRPLSIALADAAMRAAGQAVAAPSGFAYTASTSIRVEIDASSIVWPARASKSSNRPASDRR